MADTTTVATDTAPKTDATTTTSPPADTSTSTTTGQPAKKYEYAEDRSNWVPSHRVSEISEKARKADEARVAAEARATERERQLHIMTGGKPVDPEEAELEQIRARVVQLFPVLGKLTEEQLDKVLGLAEQQDSVQDSNVKIWRNHANTMLNGVYGEIEKGLGGGELSDRQRQKVYLAYRERAANDQDFLTRHEDGDQKLIQEFAKEWLDDFVEPARRMATQSQIERGRRVPSGSRTGPTTTQKPKLDLTNDDVFGEALLAEVREKGGQFAR